MNRSNSVPLVRQPEIKSNPRLRPWRNGMPAGRIDLVCRLAVPTQIYLSTAPDTEAVQTRILPLRVTGENPGEIRVSMGSVTAPVSRDGTFTIQRGGLNGTGAWRELLVGRVDGRRVLLSIYQCQLVANRGQGETPVHCKVLFRGTRWARLT